MQSEINLKYVKGYKGCNDDHRNIVRRVIEELPGFWKLFSRAHFAVVFLLNLKIFRIHIQGFQKTSSQFWPTILQCRISRILGSNHGEVFFKSHRKKRDGRSLTNWGLTLYNSKNILSRREAVRPRENTSKKVRKCFIFRHWLIYTISSTSGRKAAIWKFCLKSPTDTEGHHHVLTTRQVRLESRQRDIHN